MYHNYYFIEKYKLHTTLQSTSYCVKSFKLQHLQFFFMKLYNIFEINVLTNTELTGIIVYRRVIKN